TFALNPGKAESNLDYLVHLDKLSSLGVLDPHSIDIAADSYHRYKEDVQMAARLKLKVFRFSFSWPRILPTSNASEPNPLGVQHYHNLINEILFYNMTPLATLYHFDHPQSLETFNGWWGFEMVDKFAEYATFVINEYGSKYSLIEPLIVELCIRVTKGGSGGKGGTGGMPPSPSIGLEIAAWKGGKLPDNTHVKMWTTVNEPNVLCTFFRLLYKTAGLKKIEDMDHLVCQRHALLAHARAYRALEQSNHTGQMGLSLALIPAVPASTSAEDVYAANILNEMFAGILYHPVVYGDYSEVWAFK
ncbi:hypothetical protein KUF71_022957, partial [Frankliniella fusca]